MSLRLRTLPAGFIVPCLPTSAKSPPSGAGWLHEIKHDGFRCIARKDGKRVSRHDRSSPEWPGRLPEAITTSTIMGATTIITSVIETYIHAHRSRRDTSSTKWRGSFRTIAA